MEEVESPSGKESNPALARGSKSLDGRMGVVVAVDGKSDAAVAGDATVGGAIVPVVVDDALELELVLVPPACSGAGTRRGRSRRSRTESSAWIGLRYC